MAVERGSQEAMIHRPIFLRGVGNPAPPFSGDVRPGDNLFTDSVIALHATTGKLAWHFQFTPHDEQDRDAAQTPVLADLPIKGVVRRAICWPNRNGFYYVLDRVTGEFLAGAPFVKVDWAQGLTSTGRPILSDIARVSEAGRTISPGVDGGTNWQNPAYDPNGNPFSSPRLTAAQFSRNFLRTETSADRMDTMPGAVRADSVASPPRPRARRRDRRAKMGLQRAVRGQLRERAQRSPFQRREDWCSGRREGCFSP